MVRVMRGGRGGDGEASDRRVTGMRGGGCRCGEGNERRAWL